MLCYNFESLIVKYNCTLCGRIPLAKLSKFVSRLYLFDFILFIIVLYGNNNLAL